ncbi:hypothetical protein BDF14DRAFT_1746785 [Spinellus fusiger]|nr:hypothetical protein BDF14DRAFT_1746785 [Spinellus fusiger]
MTVLVTDGNNCVTACKDNTVCFQNCIGNNWPSAGVTTGSWLQPSSTHAVTVVTPSAVNSPNVPHPTGSTVVHAQGSAPSSIGSKVPTPSSNILANTKTTPPSSGGHQQGSSWALLASLAMTGVWWIYQ